MSLSSSPRHGRVEKMHRWRSGGLHGIDVFAPETGGTPSQKLTASLHLKIFSREKGGIPIGKHDILGANWLLVLGVFSVDWKNPPELINRSPLKSYFKGPPNSERIGFFPCHVFFKGRCCLNFGGEAFKTYPMTDPGWYIVYILPTFTIKINNM